VTATGSGTLPTTCAVALPIPAARPYRYRIPAALADRVQPGTRVVVPLRAREVIGIVLAVDDEDDPDLKPVLLAPDVRPLLSVPLLELARWLERYHTTPIGLTLKAMLPGALWGASRVVVQARAEARAPGGASRPVMDAVVHAGGRISATRLAKRLKHPVWDTLQRLERAGAVTLETEPPDLGPKPAVERVVVLSRSLPSLLERDGVFGRAERQRAAYDAVDELGGEATWGHLTKQLGFSPAVLRGLVERSVARFEDREHVRDPFAGVDGTAPPAPTEPQRAAIRALTALAPGGVGLLFGVTGSGKTSVYLEAVKAIAGDDGGVIVLVPEIALTAQTVSRVRGVFGDAVAVLHSGLSDAERADAWREVAAGHRRIVVGARSAVFAPVPRLAAIVVDEEHDASYKHGQAPRYHARHVAMVRARHEGAVLILSSATPALETWAGRSRCTEVRLPERIGARPMPPVRMVDMRHAERVKASGVVPWTVDLDRAVAARMTAGEQVLLLLNRRGYAHYLQCATCGGVVECPHCSVALTVHQVPSRMQCHHCDHHEPIPPACPACGHETQRMRGVGTQQLERWLGVRFPEARLARMDADTTTRKWSHTRILDAVGRGEVDILFGTQMIAKGLDFPTVTLVGVVDADTGLYLPDFRAAERTFQLVAQVAGRAGRGTRGGEVIVQTRTPDHYALVAAAGHDYEAFASREAAERLSPPYPPEASLINVVLSGRNADRVGEAAATLADWLRGLVARRAAGTIDVLGPAPAPLARIKERWRWHVLLRARDRRWLGRVARYANARLARFARRDVRIALDRDPVSLL